MGQAITVQRLQQGGPGRRHLSADARPGYWRVCDYTSGDLEGRLLYAPDAGDTPNLTLPLNLQGWHRVTIGVWGDCFSLHHTYAPSGNRVRLSGDPCFRAFERDRTPPSDSISIEDFEVACANLTGQDLVIAPPRRHSGAATALAYVRCEPLSDREVEELQADRQHGDHRRLIAYNDGVGFVTSGRFRDRQDIRELVEPYRHSDVESLYWGVHRHRHDLPGHQGPDAVRPRRPGHGRAGSRVVRDAQPARRQHADDCHGTCAGDGTAVPRLPAHGRLGDALPARVADEHAVRGASRVAVREPCRDRDQQPELCVRRGAPPPGRVPGRAGLLGGRRHRPQFPARSAVRGIRGAAGERLPAGSTGTTPARSTSGTSAGCVTGAGPSPRSSASCARSSIRRGQQGGPADRPVGRHLRASGGQPLLRPGRGGVGGRGAGRPPASVGEDPRAAGGRHGALPRTGRRVTGRALAAPAGLGRRDRRGLRRVPHGSPVALRRGRRGPGHLGRLQPRRQEREGAAPAPAGGTSPSCARRSPARGPGSCSSGRSTRSATRTWAWSASRRPTRSGSCRTATPSTSTCGTADARRLLACCA